jgi:hypothetical protein
MFWRFGDDIMRQPVYRARLTPDSAGRGPFAAPFASMRSGFAPVKLPIANVRELRHLVGNDDRRHLAPEKHRELLKFQANWRL